MPRCHQRRKCRLGRHPRPRTNDAHTHTGAHTKINTLARCGARTRTNTSTGAHARTIIDSDRGAQSSPPDRKIKATVDQIRPGQDRSFTAEAGLK